MLTGELVRVRIAEGKVRPAFVDPASERLRERAADLLELFRAAVGEPRGGIDEAVDAVVGDGTDHKLVRGIVKIILDRCEFDVASAVPPPALRDRLFRLAAARGPVLADGTAGGVTADALVAEAAAELGVAPEGLHRAMWADHPERQTLTAVAVPDVDWLLHRYNVALVQAVLLRATELRLRLVRPAPERARQLLRAVKFHQLIHAVRPEDDGWTVVLDGPASIFSQTTRYGFALAKFFPAALLVPTEWRLEASIAWPGKRPAELHLSPADGLRSHYADRGGWEPRECAWFEERFRALDSGWALSRDVEPLAQGPDALVLPDFRFEKDGRVAWLEILGFWRKSTIERRVEGLRRHGPPGLVVAVSRKLAGEPGALPDEVVTFAEVVPARQVLDRIERAARRPG